MSGIGRGRGWLKLSKKPEECKLANEKMSSSVQNSANNLTDSTEEIIQAISKFTESDDGILLNQKFNYIKELLMKSCQNDADVKNTLNCICDHALASADFVEKFVIFINLKTTCSLVIEDVKFILVLITFLQKIYEDRLCLGLCSRTEIKNYFIVVMAYYNSNKLLVILFPIFTCLIALLDQADDEIISFIMTKIVKYPNFLLPEVNWQQAQKTIENVSLQNKIRTVLATKNNLSEQSKYQLLLFLDICVAKDNCNEIKLSNELLQFYAKHLDAKELLVLVQGASDANLAISSMYINVEGGLVSNPVKNVFPRKKVEPNNFIPPNSDAMNESDKSGSETNEQSVKNGRPILGAGYKNNSREKNNAISNKTRDRGKKSVPRRRNGWEHDDRFENDYE